MTVDYFAYASNMAEAVMTTLGAGHSFVAPAQLPGRRLAFTRRSIRTGTGVADIVRAEGQSVWGVLYELDDALLAALDEKEGNGWAYRRSLVRVLANGCEPAREAQAYSVIAPEPVEIAPSHDYLQGILGAARERALPEEYVAALAARFA